MKNTRVTSMTGVSDSTCPKLGPDASRSIDSGHLAVGGPNQCPPLLNDSLSDELHPQDEVTGDEGSQLFIEGLSFVLRVKNLSVFQPEPKHFQVRENEPFLFNDVDDFPDIFVGIWLDHGVSPSEFKEKRTFGMSSKEAIDTFLFQLRTSSLLKRRRNQSA